MRAAIVNEARTWLAVPWRHQGRDREFGVDCVGLVLCVAWALGLAEGDHTGYKQGVYGRKFRERLAAAGLRHKPLDAVRYGDVVVLSEERYPCHMGILARGTLIHAHIRYRAVVEEPYAGEWQGKALDAFAYPGVED